MATRHRQLALDTGAVAEHHVQQHHADLRVGGLAPEPLGPQRRVDHPAPARVVVTGAHQVPKIPAFADELGDDYSRELVHVDNLVVLRARGARTKLKK